MIAPLPLPAYVCDSEGYLAGYNEPAAALWGYRPQIGKGLENGPWKRYSSDGTPMPPSHCPVAETLRTGTAIEGREMIIEQPGGVRFNVIAHAHPLFDEKDVLIGVVNTLVDITRQQRYETLEEETRQLAHVAEELKQREQRYSRMVAEVEDYAIFFISREGKIENWNKGAEKMKGYQEEEIVGKSFTVFYSEDDRRSGLPQHLMDVATTTGKANHEGWRIRKDGSRFWGSVTITALHDNAGKVVGFCKVTRDLTERREQELKLQQVNADLQTRIAMLQESELRFNRMVAEVEDYVIIMLDANGLILNWNKGAQKIKGYSADEIIGKPFTIFYSEEDKAKGIPGRLIRQAVETGKALHEGWRLRKNGSTFWGSVVLTAVHDDEGRVLGFTKVTRDLTEKMLSEEKLRATSMTLQQKNKELERINEELSSFAYISSHDLQEPLRKIQTFADRIMEMEYQNLTEKGKDYFRRMQAGASRMQKLIRDILSYSRTTTSEKKLELTDLNDLLNQAMVELEVPIMEKKAVIKSDRLPAIKVIPFQVQQLFNNLLNNALKFSKPDTPPHIVIQYEMVDGSDLEQAYPIVANGYCHISIRDNGIGFEPEYSKKIFEVFQRLDGRHEYGGTGIGLAICKKIVENHHGVIDAEGMPGEGAVFRIYLPVLE